MFTITINNAKEYNRIVLRCLCYNMPVYSVCAVFFGARENLRCEFLHNAEFRRLPVFTLNRTIYTILHVRRSVETRREEPPSYSLFFHGGHPFLSYRDTQARLRNKQARYIQ